MPRTTAGTSGCRKSQAAGRQPLLRAIGEGVWGERGVKQDEVDRKDWGNRVMTLRIRMHTSSLSICSCDPPKIAPRAWNPTTADPTAIDGTWCWAGACRITHDDDISLAARWHELLWLPATAPALACGRSAVPAACAPPPARHVFAATCPAAQQVGTKLRIWQL